MTHPIDETRRPASAAGLVSDLPLPEQTFFADPVLDRVMGITMALAAEVYVLRSRLRAVERAQRRAGGGAAADVALSAEEAAAERRDAAAFAAHLLEPAIGEQQARGPL